ncbi:hypothetical protein [Leucobacter sp. wl10]|uniref:hypothetical protein n=1 Tax=Leucobacter sp. wl10 TaxID=2304677 RepID=UPI0013C2FD19|nr:hypothetical protein [Leucobacter sp. wl10]
MRYFRTSSTGRRITAEPRVREEPDVQRLVALVIHLAEQLHAAETQQAQHRPIETREDHPSSPLSHLKTPRSKKESKKNDTPHAHART